MTTKTRKKFIGLMMAITLLFSYNADAGERIKIVATTRTFASLVKEVGGDLIQVDSVAPPNQNVHFIEPRPSDVLRLSKADLFVHAGLDLEQWRDPFAEATGKADFLQGRSRQLDLSQGISLLEIPDSGASRLGGDIHIYGNPHYWLDPRNALVMAQSIYEKLAEIRPESRGRFKENLDRFLEKLNQKLKDWERRAAALRGIPVVAYHNSWPYLAEFTGLEIVGFVEPRPGIPPTAKHLSGLANLMRKSGVKWILKESYFENKTPERLSRETGTRVLVLAHGVGEAKEVTDYIALFDYNLRIFEEALSQEGHSNA